MCGNIVQSTLLRFHQFHRMPYSNSCVSRLVCMLNLCLYQHHRDFNIHPAILSYNVGTSDKQQAQSLNRGMIVLWHALGPPLIPRSVAKGKSDHLAELSRRRRVHSVKQQRDWQPASVHIILA